MLTQKPVLVKTELNVLLFIILNLLKLAILKCTSMLLDIVILSVAATVGVAGG